MPDQKPMPTRCLGGFSVMWITKLLISPVKIRIFCPKKSKFGPKMAFLFILGQALPAHLVGGCCARAVSRKTPIYFSLFKMNLKNARSSCKKEKCMVVVVKRGLIAVGRTFPE